MIEPLPEGHTFTCDKVNTGGGWSRRNGDPARCGQPAVVVDSKTCNCGACDMSCHLCDYHARRIGTEAQAREDHENWCTNMMKYIKQQPDSEHKAESLSRWEDIRRKGSERFFVAGTH